MTESAGGTQKKGLSTLAWVGIGCGVLALIGVVALVAIVGFGVSKAKDVVGDFQDNPAKAAALLAVRVNPDLELVSTDDAAGTMTVRDVRDGKEFTLDFEEIAEGRFSVTTEDGEFSVDGSEAQSGGGVTVRGPDGETRIGAVADLSQVPGWVPRYPAADDLTSSYHSTAGGETSGAVSGTTSDTLDEVISWYRTTLEGNGYEVSTQTLGSGDSAFASLSGEHEGDGRTVTVMVNRDSSGPNRMTVTYSGKADD